MNNLQRLIGGGKAPVHNDNLQFDMNQTGSLLGQSLELEPELAERLAHNLLHKDENVLNLTHSIGYTYSHTTEALKFEKSLSRMLVPTLASFNLDGLNETPFVATPQHRVPFIGETIKDDPAHPGQKFICTGHKYVLSNATPTQIINNCVNAPWEVMTKCVYFYNGRYWNIVNIKELLSVIMRAKVTLFNNNEITKYKQQHREQFMFMNRRNQAANRGMTIFVTKVVMNLSFSSASDIIMDIRETRNQIGRLAWSKVADLQGGNKIVNSIIAKRSPAGLVIETYQHQSYESDVDRIDDDSGIVTRAAFNFKSNIEVNAVGNAADAGDVEKFKLKRTALNNLGNTTQASCLFPANARDEFDNTPGNRAIPQRVLNVNGRWDDNSQITAMQLRAMYSTLEVKVMPNQSVTIN